MIADRPGRSRALAIVHALIMATCISACASVGGPQVGAGAGHRGEPYYLPKAEAAIALGIPEANNITVSIDTAMVADTGAGVFYLRRTSGVLSADTVEIKVGSNQLLSSVSATSDSRSGEIATGVGEVIGQLESAIGNNVLVSDTFDPTSDQERDDLGERLSGAVADWAVREERLISSRPTAASRLAQDATQEQKNAALHEDQARQERLVFLGEASRTAIEVEWEWNSAVAPVAAPPPGTPSQRAGQPADCARAICVRAARPGRLRIFRCTTQNRYPTSCAGSRRILVTTVVANIPNDAPASQIVVEGGVFADMEHNLTLTDGMLRSYKTVRGNEVEGVVTFAGNLLGGIVSGTVEAFSSEKQIVEAETNLLNARTTRVQALAELERAEVGDTSGQGDPEVGSPEAFLSDTVMTVGLFGPIDIPTPPTPPTSNEVPQADPSPPTGQKPANASPPPTPDAPVLVPGFSGTQTQSGS